MKGYKTVPAADGGLIISFTDRFHFPGARIVVDADGGAVFLSDKSRLDLGRVSSITAEAAISLALHRFESLHTLMAVNDPLGR